MKKPTKKQQLQAALDVAKDHCNHIPENGRIEYESGHGYYIRFLNDFDQRLTYCWLGKFERGMKFIEATKTTGRPNFASLRVGIK